MAASTSPSLLPTKPTYRCQVDSRIHPDSVEIAAKTQQYFLNNWFSDEEEAKQYLNQDVEQLVVLTIPDARKDKMEIISKWFTWGFLLDDKMEDLTEDLKGFVDIMDLIARPSKPVEGNKIGRVTYHIFQGFLAGDTEYDLAYGKDVIDKNVLWIKQVLLARQINGHFETLDDFIAHRAKTAGPFVAWPAIRWGCNIEVPLLVLESPELRSMEHIASLHCALVNDLYSFRKETMARGGQARVSATDVISENIMFVFMKDQTEDEARERLEDYISTLEGDFICAMEQAIDRYGDEVGLRRYGDALKACMGGNVTWSETCGRYNDESLWHKDQSS